VAPTQSVVTRSAVSIQHPQTMHAALRGPQFQGAPTCNHAAWPQRTKTPCVTTSQALAILYRHEARHTCMRKFYQQVRRSCESAICTPPPQACVSSSTNPHPRCHQRYSPKSGTSPRLQHSTLCATLRVCRQLCRLAYPSRAPSNHTLTAQPFDAQYPVYLNGQCTLAVATMPTCN
jgi:hypothetical protein